jgi:hypothetical protein
MVRVPVGIEAEFGIGGKQSFIVGMRRHFTQSGV